MLPVSRRPCQRSAFNAAFGMQSLGASRTMTTNGRRQFGRAQRWFCSLERHAFTLALAASLPFALDLGGRQEPGRAAQDSQVCAASSIETLRKLAEGGSPEAQKELAGALVTGQCVKQDLVEAARWYQESASRGNADAKFRLGMMYLQGEGVSVNPSRGQALLRQAAEAGHAQGQYAIGSLYASGRGVRKDHVQAYKWIKLSIRDDAERESEVLKGLTRDMTQAEIAAAERQVADWKRAHEK